MRPLLPVVLLAAASPAQDPADPQPVAPAPYVRLVEEDAGRVLRLDLCVRTLEPAAAEGPRIVLASVVHVGEPAYYRAMQTVLDRFHVVLYEQVGGTRGVDPGPLAPAELARVRATERRLRTLAVAVAAHRTTSGLLPREVEQLDATPAVDRARRDAWDRPIALIPGDGDTYDLLSHGADGAPGGEGASADLRFSDQAPLHPAELGGDAGLQTALAEALGLVFQLDEVDYGGVRWRNSDMGIAELEERMRGADLHGGAGALLDALDGSSALAKLGGFLLKLLGSSKEGRGALKLVGIEVLSRADELLAAAPGDMGALLEIIVSERNAIVVRDLRAVLADEPDVRSIAIFYGAGHMPGLERSLASELGYGAAGDAWLTAARVDTADLGMPPEQVRFLRRTIQRSLDRELGEGR